MRLKTNKILTDNAKYNNSNNDDNVANNNNDDGDKTILLLIRMMIITIIQGYHVDNESNNDIQMKNSTYDNTKNHNLN